MVLPGRFDYLRRAVLPGKSGFGRLFFPGSHGRLDNQAFLDRRGTDTNVPNLAVDDGFDALQIGHEASFGYGRDVSADAAFAFRFTTAPDLAALGRALAC